MLNLAGAVPLTPDQIDWTTVPATSGQGGKTTEPRTTVTLSRRAAELLTTARERHGHTSDAATVEGALSAYVEVQS